MTATSSCNVVNLRKSVIKVMNIHTYTRNEKYLSCYIILQEIHVSIMLVVQIITGWVA